MIHKMLFLLLELYGINRHDIGWSGRLYWEIQFYNEALHWKWLLINEKNQIELLLVQKFSR